MTLTLCSLGPGWFRSIFLCLLLLSYHLLLFGCFSFLVVSLSLWYMLFLVFPVVILQVSKPSPAVFTGVVSGRRQTWSQKECLLFAILTDHGVCFVSLCGMGWLKWEGTFTHISKRLHGYYRQGSTLTPPRRTCPVEIGCGPVKKQGYWICGPVRASRFVCA